MRPDDIERLVECSDPRQAPDGRVAYVVTRPDLASNEYRSAVWVWAGGTSTCVTEGLDRAARPRWSPGGDLAFVVRTGDRSWELRVGSRTLFESHEDVEELVWSPDGTRLAFVMRDRAPRYEAEKERDRAPLRVTRLHYRLDSVGWTADRPRHLFVVDVASATVTQLTDGEYQDAGCAWSPDGQWLAFSSGRTETWDTDLVTDIWRVPAVGGSPERLTDATKERNRPSWSPDGRWIAYVVGDRSSFSRHGRIGVLEVSTGEERIVTANLDLHCAPYLAAAREPVWSEDSSSVVFQVDEAGDLALYRATLDGEVGRLSEPVCQVTGFDGTVSTISTPRRGPELYADGVRVTEHVDDALAVAEPERFTAVSSDGTEVEAWVMKPPGDGPHPTILNIHGGPFSQYGNRFFDEFQAQVAAGYGVIYANPRGSSGYSEVFARGTRGPKAEEDPGTGWGGADYEDLMAVVDEALRRFPWIDADRLGVQGGSYGGYMTSWIVGHTDRFRAACSERALNNMLTFAHTSDIGTYFPAGYIGATHLEDPDEFVRQSPTTYADRITTPLLILHSENDLRCPIEQAEDLFVRLKMRGADVEFVRFPGESHELSRSGSPRHRVERLRVILDFFDRKLR